VTADMALLPVFLLRERGIESFRRSRPERRFLLRSGLFYATMLQTRRITVERVGKAGQGKQYVS